MIRTSLDAVSQIFEQKDFLNMLENNAIDIEISYISDFRSTKNIRDFGDTLLEVFGITPKWRTRFILILDELNNNAVEYGSLEEDINILKISLLKNEGVSFDVSFEVTDSGRGKFHKTSKEMYTLKELHIQEDFLKHDSIRGRGLFLIIYRMVDQLYFQDSVQGGLTVGVKKHLLQEDL